MVRIICEKFAFLVSGFVAVWKSFWEIFFTPISWFSEKIEKKIGFWSARLVIVILFIILPIFATNLFIEKRNASLDLLYVFVCGLSVGMIVTGVEGFGMAMIMDLSPERWRPADHRYRKFVYWLAFVLIVFGFILFYFSVINILKGIRFYDL